jgi:Carboxypeptidase regulatory-like domain
MNRLTVRIALSLLQASCLCWFVACDRAVAVTGYVGDASGAPVEGAKVEFNGDTEQTDAAGCFSFEGVLRSDFRIEVEKQGFKPYAEGRRYDFYRIDVRLVPQSSSEASTGAWHSSRDLPSSELPHCQPGVT